MPCTMYKLLKKKERKKQKKNYGHTHRWPHAHTCTPNIGFRNENLCFQAQYLAAIKEGSDGIVKNAVGAESLGTRIND